MKREQLRLVCVCLVFNFNFSVSDCKSDGWLYFKFGVSGYFSDSSGLRIQKETMVSCMRCIFVLWPV